MIDLCCHILPGLDGGAPYLEASLKMAELAVESGCRTIVTTPISADNSDSMYRVYESKKLSDAYLALAGQLPARNITLELRSGMLLHASNPQKIREGLKRGYLYPLEGTRYVLLDLSGYCSFASGTDRTGGEVRIRDRILEMTRVMREAGYRPIYTRPEHLDIFLQDPDLCAVIIDEGGFFLGSKQGLLGRFDTASQDVLMYMISQGYISAIASFAVHHDFDTPHMGEAADLLLREFSDETASLMLEINPERILDNELPLVPASVF